MRICQPHFVKVSHGDISPPLPPSPRYTHIHTRICNSRCRKASNPRRYLLTPDLFAKSSLERLAAQQCQSHTRTHTHVHTHRPAPAVAGDMSTRERLRKAFPSLDPEYYQGNSTGKWSDLGGAGRGASCSASPMPLCPAASRTGSSLSSRPSSPSLPPPPPSTQAHTTLRAYTHTQHGACEREHALFRHTQHSHNSHTFAEPQSKVLSSLVALVGPWNFPKLTRAASLQPCHRHRQSLSGL